MRLYITENVSAKQATNVSCCVAFLRSPEHRGVVAFESQSRTLELSMCYATKFIWYVTSRPFTNPTESGARRVILFKIPASFERRGPTATARATEHRVVPQPYRQQTLAHYWYCPGASAHTNTIVARRGSRSVSHQSLPTMFSVDCDTVARMDTQNTLAVNHL